MAYIAKNADQMENLNIDYILEKKTSRLYLLLFFELEVLWNIVS